MGSPTVSWSGGFFEALQGLGNLWAAWTGNYEAIKTETIEENLAQGSNPVTQITTDVSNLWETTTSNTEKFTSDVSEDWNKFWTDVGNNWDSFWDDATGIFDNVKWVIIAIAVIAVVAIVIYLIMLAKPYTKSLSKITKKIF